MIERPRGRDFEAPELEGLARDLAARPALWSHAVRHDPEQRQYAELFCDAHLAVWLLCWSAEQDTGFHDHDISAGAVAVVQGAVHEDRLALGGPPATRVVEAGGSFHFTAADPTTASPAVPDRVLHEGDEPAVTLHLYSPPLWRMGAYFVGEDGSLARPRCPTPRSSAPCRRPPER